MADDPRRPPRRGRDDDRDDDRDLYRLRDDDEQPRPAPRPRPRPVRRDDGDAGRVAPRPRPARRRDDEDFDDVRARRPLRRTASSMTPDTRVRLIILGVVLVAALIGLAIFGIWYAIRSSQAGVFASSLNSYLAAPAGAAPPNAPHAVAGKMVVVDTTRSDVDWDIHFGLPDDLQAKGPQEVGTIVQTKWAKVHEPPDYDNGALAYVQECDVTVIDAASHMVIGQQHFRGGDPPQSIQNSSEGVGSKPTDEVLNYLKGLPRR